MCLATDDKYLNTGVIIISFNILSSNCAKIMIQNMEINDTGNKHSASYDTKTDGSSLLVSIDDIK